MELYLVCGGFNIYLSAAHLVSFERLGCVIEGWEEIASLLFLYFFLYFYYLHCVQSSVWSSGYTLYSSTEDRRALCAEA